MDTTFATDNLRLERDGSVGRLVLDRPDRLNAFTIEMWHEMADLGRRLVDEDELRALVVTGSGRAFSSGIDVEVFGAAAPSLDADAIQRLQAAFDWLEDAPFATVAAMRGYALGGGLQCALACDLRIAAEGTALGILELDWGIIPDLGGTQRLPRLVGPGRAKELILTSARIDAAEAHRIGLVERVVADEDLDEQSLELARHLAARPPLAVRAVKALVDASFEQPLSEGLRAEAETQLGCLRSRDVREAVAAAAEGRAPVFEGR